MNWWYSWIYDVFLPHICRSVAILISDVQPFIFPSLRIDGHRELLLLLLLLLLL
jgi:hypothetical protein